MEHSKIEWCDHTFNPWIGCTKVSPGCANCYAETLMDKRWGKVKWGKGQPRKRTTAANWKQVERWNRQAEHDAYGAELCGLQPIRPRVFVASLADWLDPEVPVEWLADLLGLIHRCKHLDFLMLTKRPELWWERMEAVLSLWCPPDAASHIPKGGVHLMFGSWQKGFPPANVWIGTTVEDQKRADERIPALLHIPAKVRFLSCEPLLEVVELDDYLTESPIHEEVDFFNESQWIKDIDWIICGGESGPNARPMNVEWARSLSNQCKAAGIAFFMKQMGGTRKPFPEIPADLMVREFPLSNPQAVVRSERQRAESPPASCSMKNKE